MGARSIDGLLDEVAPERSGDKFDQRLLAGHVVVERGDIDADAIGDVAGGGPRRLSRRSAPGRHERWPRGDRRRRGGANAGSDAESKGTGSGHGGGLWGTEIAQSII